MTGPEMAAPLPRSDGAAIRRLLDRLGIAYTHAGHPPAHTMADLSGVEETLGAPFCKNLFLCNRQQTAFYLLLLAGDRRFRTAEVSRKLGSARLSFGPEDSLYRLLGVRPGAITPLGLAFDPGHRVQVVVDRDLLGAGRVCVHPCVNTESVAMSTRDLLEVFIPHWGHRPIFIGLDPGGPGEEV